MYRSSTVSIGRRAGILLRKYTGNSETLGKKVHLDAMIKATKMWIHSVVVGFRLCPWAGKHVNNVQIRIVADYSIQHASPNESEVLFEECIKIATDFANSQQKDLSEFILLPQLHCFIDYLEFSETFNELLEYSQLDSRIQVATFHPEYQFDGTEANDPENWTNRSPFPTLHLLKVADVSEAIESYEGSTDEIWKKNVRTIRAQGNEKMQSVMDNILKESQM